MPCKLASDSWRRYLRFSLRGMLVLVLVIAAGMGRIVNQARTQRDAVAAIRKAGGNVCYVSGLPSVSAGSQLPGWKRWIAEWVGLDYVDHVDSVHLD